MQLLTKYLTLLFLSMVLIQLIGGDVNHWETIIGSGGSCQYLVPGFAVDPAWINRDFNDTLWSGGAGGVGYGDDDDSTTIDPAISVYCRYHFDITEPGVITGLLLDVDFDDGFVAYLNGTGQV